MKRFFTLFVMALALSAAAWAEKVDQTFVFVDTLGNVLPDGAVITVSKVGQEGDMSIPVRVRNVQGDKAAVSMFENIDAIPNGEWQTCAFGNCMMLNATGYSAKNIFSGTADTDIQTEWIPETNKYASWSATLQIHVFDIVTQSRFGIVTEVPGNNVIDYGPTLTVNFVYNESSDIKSLQTGETAKEYFDLRGQRLNAPRKGLNIIKLADGETVKKMVK